MSADEIAELIDQAGFGLVSWDSVNAAIAAAFPGSFSAIASHRRKTGQANFASIVGMDEKRMDDYFSYYATINPWNPFWASMKSGQVMRSELDCPTSLFEKTEFINDWLMPIQTASIGMGLKLESHAEDDLFLAVHLPGNQSGHASEVLEMLRRQAGNLARAVEMNRLISANLNRSIAAASLVERGSDIGFVVDYNLRVVEANAQANAAFSTGDPIKNGISHASFRDGLVHQWFSDAAKRLILGRPIAETKRHFINDDHVWQVKLSRVQEYDPRNGNRFLPATHLALVLVRDIRNMTLPPNGLDALGVFELTAAEMRMCRLLAQGYAVKEAADMQGVAVETARFRLKSIFQKTGTHRQPELMALLMRAM